MNRVTESLGPFALSLGLLAITVGAVAIVLAAMQPAAYDPITVEDEAQSPSTPLPTNVTVAKESDPNFEGIDDGSVSIVLNDTDPSTGTTTTYTLTEDENYTVYYDDGNVEYTDLTANYSSTEDTAYVTYDWLDSDTTAHSTLQDGLSAMSDFGGWLGIIVIMGVITVIFLFLGVVRRAGTRVAA